MLNSAKDHCLYSTVQILLINVLWAVIEPTETGGLCTFCGGHVKLHLHESSSNSNGNQKLPQEEAKSSLNKEMNEIDEVQEKAIKFKDKLVHYDRNAEKRTTVIDDQSDFFEIDTNVWLSDKV